MEFDFEDVDSIVRKLKEEASISDHHFKDALTDLIYQARGRSEDDMDILYEDDTIILKSK